MTQNNFPSVKWDDLPKISASQMQQLASLATGKYGLDIRMIVEHTGRNLVDLANSVVSEGPVLVAAGRGNNGSGGLAAARLFAAQNRSVWVVPTHEAENYSGVTKDQLELLKHYPNVRVRSSLPKMKFACVIDSAIGTQLEGPPRGRTLDVITVLNSLRDSGSLVISLDTPTGMVSDTGEIPGEAVNASMTLAIALPKRGVTPGSNAGDIYIGDFGVPPGVYEDLSLTVPKVKGLITKVIP